VSCRIRHCVVRWRKDLGNNCITTKLRSLEDLNPQQHRCENLKYRLAVISPNNYPTVFFFPSENVLPDFFFLRSCDRAS